MEIRPRPTIEDPQATDTRRSLPDNGEHRTGRNDTGGLKDGLRSGEFSLGRDFLGEREQAFAKRLHHALGERDAGEDGSGSDEQMRLLAVAGLSPVGGGPIHDISPETRADAPRLDAMIERVEKAVAARSTESLPGAVSLTLDFGDIGGSIGGVTITLSQGSIDLVLSRAGEVADAPYVQAAQLLADRLHARFPRRIVRILEAEPQRDAPAQGLAAFSRLLDPSGDRS